MACFYDWGAGIKANNCRYSPLTSIAEQAKLTPGMELKSVAGIETPDQNAVRLALVRKICAKEVTFVVTQPNSLSESENILNLQQWNFDPGKTRSYRIPRHHACWRTVGL